MHIPKTAGTSFNAFASSRYPENAVVTHIESIDPERFPVLQAEKSYLAGHLPLGEIWRWFDVASLELLTMLREPYGQLHSHLNWVKNIGAEPKSEFFRSHHRHFRALALKLNEPDFSIVDDLVSVTGDPQKVLMSLFDNNQTRYLLENAPKKVTLADFHRAKTNLDNFKLVGVTEQFDSFARAFCRLYGSNYPGEQQRFNQSEGEKLFDHQDESVRSRLLPLVQFDLMLYDHVVTNRLLLTDQA